MARDFFKNLPNTTTPLTAPRMNAFLDGDEAMGNIVVDSVKGKNLFNKNGYSNTGYLNNDGTRTTNVNFIISNYISVEPGEKLTFSGNANPGVNASLCFYNSSFTFLSAIKHDGTSIGTITIPANCYYIRESVRLEDLDTLQIEKGETSTDYSNYEGLGYVSGNNENGEYIKYDDGTLICYGNTSYTGLRNTSMDTGGYRTSGKTITFPHSFIEVPTGLSFNDTSGTNITNGLKNIQIRTYDATIFWWGINSSVTSTTYTASYIVIGRWK